MNGGTSTSSSLVSVAGTARGGELPRPAGSAVPRGAGGWGRPPRCPPDGCALPLSGRADCWPFDAGRPAGLDACGRDGGDAVDPPEPPEEAEPVDPLVPSDEPPSVLACAVAVELRDPTVG